MFSKMLFYLMILGILFCAGCESTDTKVIAANEFSSGFKSEAPAQNVLLSVGDVVEVSVEVDGRMEVSSYQATINSMGVITLPLVGDVKVDALTLRTARNQLIQAYGSYFVSTPMIVLTRLDSGTESGWGHVTVTGEVGQPGRVKVSSGKGIKLTEVISSSGGFTSMARVSNIRVTRTEDGGRKLRVYIDFDDIGQDGDVHSDVSLFDGDIVYVPQRIF